MSNLSLNKPKQIAKMRRIKNYKNMSKERLLSALNKSESVESGNKLDNARIKKIKRDFNKLRYEFSKSKIIEPRKNLSDIKKTKKIFLNQTKRN